MGGILRKYVRKILRRIHIGEGQDCMTSSIDLMAEVDLEPPTSEWERLAQAEELTTDTIREYLKRTVPLLHAEQVAQVSYDEARCRQLFLDPISRLLAPDAQPLDEGAVSSAGGMCGRVFKKGDPTYSCRDCEQDPTCVLCVDCFKQSEHRNHRYQMCVSLGMGGYCDCGDDEAWKQDPCCATHRPRDQRDSSAATDPGSSAAAAAAGSRTVELVFSAVMQYVLSVVSTEGALLNILPLELDLGREHYPPRGQRYCTVLFNHGISAYDKVADTLVKALQCNLDEAKNMAAAVRTEGWAVLHVGDYNACDERLRALAGDQHRALRRARVHVVHAHLAAHLRLALRLLRRLRSALESTPRLRAHFHAAVMQRPDGADEPSILDQLLAVDQRMWNQARQESHLLLIQGMLMDINSKKAFAEVFTDRYEEQMLSSLPSAVQEQSGIQDLSVQIFTVPSVAHHLIAQKAALSVVLNTLVTECKRHAHGGQLVLREVSASGDARSRFERFLTCLTDARYLLTVVPEAPMAAPLRRGLQRGLDTLLELLFCCEGMEPVMRAQTAHVLYDSPYELQVTLAITLAPVVAQTVEWCGADRQLLIHAYKATLRRLQARLPPERYFRQDETQLLGRSVQVSQFPVTEMPVSLELPLSRLFSGLHLKLAGQGLEFDSEELALDRRVLPRTLLERPLRALIMDAQVRAGLWRRNGRSLDIICSWYSLSMQVAEMRDRDLHLSQICASLMEPDKFVTLLLFRHGAHLYFTPAAERAADESQEGDARDHIENNMADALLLLMHVFGERFHPGIGQVTREQCLENEVIQFLSVKPMAHSQITKRLPDADGGLLETVLRRVADFDAHEDFRALRTYQLKPAYYGQYNCMWGHFSRRDRSWSEQLQQRRCQEAAAGGAGAAAALCLPPPPQPAFQRHLAAARSILTCETTLRVLRAILQRLSAGDQGGLSEQIYQRALFLIGMALNEEEQRRPGGFCFSRPAQQSGLADTLHDMATGGGSSSAHAGLLTWVVAKLDRLLGNSGSAGPAAAAAAAAASAGDAQSEQARRRAAAAARRARILGQMQAQQRKFVAQNQTALQSAAAAMEAEAAAPEAGRLVKAGSSMDVSEAAAEVEEAAPVCLGPRQSARPAAAAEQTCILCQHSETISAGAPAWVTAAFVQSSTVLAREARQLPDNGEFYPSRAPFLPTSLSWLPHAGGCGHAMHAACWRQHFESVVWSRRSYPRVQHLAGYDVQQSEFLCPLCQRLSNAVVPLLPTAAPGAAAAAAADGPVPDDFALWLAAVVRAAATPEGASTSADHEQLLGSFSEPEAAQLRRLAAQGDAPPDVHKSIRDLTHKLLKTVLLRSGASQMAHAALLCCGYSLLATEQLLRHQRRALLPPDGGRANLCLAQMALLCSTLLPNQKTTPLRDQVALVLRALLSPADAAQSATVYTPENVTVALAVDAVGLVVFLSCGLRSLLLPPGGPVPGVSGSVMDLHCVRLALLLRITQLLLTFDSAACEPMDTGDSSETGGSSGAPPPPPPASEEEEAAEAAREAHWLQELYAVVRAEAGLDECHVDGDALRRDVVDELAPFLRCCALFFHYVTGVRAPPELQRPSGLRQQHRHLLRYLGLDTLRLPAAVRAGHPVRQLVANWCRGVRRRHPDGGGGGGGAAALRNKRPLVSYRPARLIPLPTNYEDLLIQASALRCPCGETEFSPSPALCLVCGAWLCSEMSCGRDTLPPQRTQRGMDAHALRCGAGSAILFLPRKCKVHLVHANEPTARKSTFPPPYVDRFGEVDQGLRRGNPLSLQPRLLQRIATVWLSHGVSDQVAAYMEEFSSGMLFE